MKYKSLQRALILMVSLMLISLQVWGQTDIFTATPQATSDVSVSSVTDYTNFTAEEATFTGGSMQYKQSNAKNKTILKASIGPTGDKRKCFRIETDDCSFKVVLNSALQNGDVISADLYNNNVDIWFSTSTSKPGSAPSTKISASGGTSSAWNSGTYTVTTGDGICGQTTFYIYRNSNTTQFSFLTITRPPVATNWYVKGGWNSWGTTDNFKGGETEISAKVNITTAGAYEFKIWNNSGGDGTWYGNGGNIGCNVSGWVFDTSSGNCRFFASETGNYIFKFNTSTKALSVTYPTAQGKYYYKNTSSWGSVAVYRYVSSINNGWPGTIVSETETVCGDTYYVTYADPGTTLIFNNNNGGSQTGNMAASGNAGKYVSGTGDSWNAFTCNVTYDANGGTGTAPTDATTYSSGSSVSVKDNSNLTKSGYYFAGWNTKADGSGDTYVLGQTFEITTCTTLYAKWNAVSCPDGSVEGIVFKLQMNNVGTTRSLVANEYINTTIYATMTNGSAIFGSTGTTEVTKADPGKLKFGANAVSLKLNLGCTLQAGDVISFTAGESYELSFTTSSTRATTLATSSKSYTIPAGSPLIGVSTIYCWRSTSNTINVTSLTITRPAGCDAPSALAKSSVTAKGVTLTVTDANDINDYEFYVSTSSTAPLAGATATHTVTSNKSKTITNLVAGTTYYAWARSKCGASNKSDWVALTDDKFTTSTVTVTHILTNVTKSSGAETAGGSDYTAVFAAASGYSLPTPSVTIDGAAKTSGTDYTWTAGTGTITIPANKINGNIVITMNSAATAPTNVAISGTYHYYPGETISLTATPTGGNGPKTYQWYHGGTADGNAISGATSATYSKASCVVGDAGSYYCKVTCGGSASRWSDGATQKTAFNVKIMQFYLKNSGGSDISNHALTKVDATHASLSLSLTGGTTYKFRVTDGCGNWYGNTGEMTSSNCTNWAMDADADCRVTTSTKSATYTFNFDFSGGLLGSQMKVSVVYPAGDQAADKIIYWDNSVLNWAAGKQWYRIGKGNHNNKTQMTLVPGTANLYKVTTAEYNGFEYWHIANNEGEGTGNVFWTKDSDPTTDEEITAAIGFEGAPVTAAAVTVTPGADHSTGSSSDNNNCEFYSKTITTGMKTDRVTISDYSNGTITVNYVSTSNVASSFTSGYQDLAHTVKLTSITAVADDGYDASAITINGGAYAANYVVAGATTIAASFTPHVYTITLNKGDYGAANQSATVAYLGDALTSITHVAANTGYNHLGYYDGSTKVLNADGSFAANTVSGYITDGVWTKTADATLTAKWEAQTYTISYKDQGNKTYSGSNLTSLPTSHTYGAATALVNGVKAGYTFGGWYTDASCTVSAGSSIGATAKTANFTLYAKWSYNCPADNSGNTIYKFVPVTSSTDNIADATEFTTENYLSELTGGTLTSHCSSTGNVKMNSNGVQLAAAAGYLELNFECALQTGDKVKWKCYAAGVYLCNTTTYNSSNDLTLAKSQDSYSEAYITSAMEGKTKLYIMHTGSNATVMTFELYRAGGYRVTYKANGSGESDVVNIASTAEDNMFTRNGYTFTGWDTKSTGDGTAYAVGDAVASNVTLYAQWTCTTPTFGTNLSTTPHDVEQGDPAVTLTVAATANSGTVTYQWYSNTSKSTTGATTLTTGASYNAPTSSLGTLYYYCVATNTTGGGCTAQSNYATVTVSEVPCLRATITKSSGKYSLSGGETKDITSDATVTSGGAVKLVNYNASSKDFSFSDGGVSPGTNDGYVEVVLPSGSALDEGSVIRITGSGSAADEGLLLIDDAGTTVESQTNNGAIDFSYTVTSSSTLKYLTHIRIKRAKSSSGNKFKSVTITGCVACTPITPTLSYSATTLYLEGGANTATPTLTGNTGSGAVTYSSSNTSVVKVNASTGIITAAGAGSAIITATIAPSGDYCGAAKSVTITVPSLVQQTVNLNSAWSTVPNMTFPGDPTSTLTKNANVAATGYSIDESDNKSGLSSKIYGIPSSTSKNDNYYMSLKFNTPSYGVRLTKVVVPIQPIAQTVSAIVTVSDGTTTVTSNEVADIAAGSKKTCNFTITPTTFAAGKTITVKIFVYDQTTGTNGFRFGSPILVNGSVITSDFEFTGDGANANWDTPANWNWRIVPTINNDVIIEKPCVIAAATKAEAKSVVIDQNGTNTGSIDIQPTGELIIAQTLRKTTDGSSLIATTENDLSISTSADGNGVLAIGSHDGTNRATVNFYTKACKTDADGWINQFIGTPFGGSTGVSNDVMSDYYGSYIYKFNAATQSWDNVKRGNATTAFAGYNILRKDAAPSTLWMQGALNASDDSDKELTLTYNGENTTNIIANSWMAPIDIASMTGAFTNCEATVYLFNAGSKSQAGTTEFDTGSADDSNTSPGQFIALPVASAPWTSPAITVIPSMQAFLVVATAANPKVTLNYSTMVLTPLQSMANAKATAGNRAPRRNVELNDAKPDIMRLHVAGMSGGTDIVYLLMREDFTTDFDNGYDGRKMLGDDANPQLYALSNAGDMAISCIPDAEGTVLAFRRGTDTDYRMTFAYDGWEVLYLNDLKTSESVIISELNDYRFTATEDEPVNRFVISATPIHYVPTDIDNSGAISTALKAKKVIINDHLYIIKGNNTFSVTGVMMK